MNNRVWLKETQEFLALLLELFSQNKKIVASTRALVSEENHLQLDPGGVCSALLIYFKTTDFSKT